MLRPVGEPVPLRLLEDPEPLPVPRGFVPLFLGSGTAALALGLKAAASGHTRGRPAVVLPGYGCPDLVSAAVHCGLEIRVADTRAGSPFIGPETVEPLLDADVVAVVGAHFLGLRQALAPLRALCRDAGCLLVEDSAQLFPRGDYGAPAGDLVVHSFGRGKPGGALGGGALFVREDLVDRIPEAARYRAPGMQATLSARAGLALHAFLLGDRLFSVLEALPGLGVGETRYRALERLAPLDAGRMAAAAAGVVRWRREGSPGGPLVSDALDGVAGLTDLVATAGADRASLLRYPVLTAGAARTRAVIKALHGHGIGASPFYGRALPALDGLPVALPFETPQAADFASRLVTLPAHSGVSREITDTLRSSLAGLASVAPDSPSVMTGSGRP